MTRALFGILRDQRRQVPEHPLQAHVLRLAGRLDLAGVVVVQHAAARARDCDRRIPAFTHVDDVGFADARGRVAAVSDEDVGNAVDRARQEHRAGHRTGEQQRAGELHPALLGGRLGEGRVEHQQRGDRRNDDHQLLRLFGSEPDREQQAAADRAGNRAEGVCGVDTADEPGRVFTPLRDRRQCEREARAPEGRRREHRPERAHHVELKVYQMPSEVALIEGLNGQHGSDSVDM